MKKELVFVLLVLFFSSFVFAMDDPITVKTDPENEVKIYAWPVGGGQLLNLGKGPANGEGFFSTTFFSLNQPFVKFQILVINSRNEKIKDVVFDNQPIDQAILIDCTVSTGCEISFGGELSEEEAIVEEEIIVEEIIVEEPVVDLRKFSFKERIEFQGAYGTWLYAVGGFFTFAILFLMWFRFQQFKEFLLRINYFSEEGELLRLEKKIRHKDSLMVRFKEVILRKKRIKSAKSQLKSKGNKLEKMVRSKMKKRTRSKSKNK
ncbi:MAG: hypothetical protein IH845_01965 [Nanoarchaeota archaeon]|nr:hypothetical protein [Nanoarchaeota archaeon]